jgi:hypothetical protein
LSLAASSYRHYRDGWAAVGGGLPFFPGINLLRRGTTGPSWTAAASGDDETIDHISLDPSWKGFLVVPWPDNFRRTWTFHVPTTAWTATSSDHTPLRSLTILLSVKGGRLVDAHDDSAGQVFHGEQVGHVSAVLDQGFARDREMRSIWHSNGDRPAETNMMRMSNYL